MRLARCVNITQRALSLQNADNLLFQPGLRGRLDKAVAGAGADVQAWIALVPSAQEQLRGAIPFGEQQHRRPGKAREACSDVLCE